MHVESRISIFKWLLESDYFAIQRLRTMARVFNICFQYEGKSYTALVSVNGKEDSSVTVTTNTETIQIILPTGRLIFSIGDVLQRIYVTPDRKASQTSFYVTPNISLQLLNTDW